MLEWVNYSYQFPAYPLSSRSCATTMSLHHLRTEQSNTFSADLDLLSIEQAVSLMNREDALVASSVSAAQPAIANAIHLIASALAGDGRLIYVGAGNSGRLGYLDALECQPTFSMPAGKVIGLVAGGFGGEIGSAEDYPEHGQADLAQLQLQAADVVVGLSASGRTPYVIGALEYARNHGCATVAVACNRNSAISAYADVAIEVDCGPEILAGSTRLKAGTAQKMICNMLTTLSMVSIGKTYGNLMVDVQVRNHKLRQRALAIVMQATDAEPELAQHALEAAQQRPRIAILMLLARISAAQAEALCEQHRGSIYRALQAHTAG